MAKRGTHNEVGELNVAFRGDLSDLKKTAAQAKAEVDGVATHAEGAAKKIEGASATQATAVGRAADSTVAAFKRQVSAFTSFIGTLTAAVAVWHTFFDIGTRIGQMLFDNANKTEEFLEKLRGGGAKEAAGNVRAIEEEILQLEHALRQAQNALGPLAGTAEGEILKLYFGDPDRMAARLERLRAAERAFRQQDRAAEMQQAREQAQAKARIEQEAAEKVAEAERNAKLRMLDDVAARARDLEIQQLDGIARVNAEQKRALEELQAVYDSINPDAGSEGWKRLEQLGKAINADADRRRAEVQERQAEEARRAEEKRRADEKAAEMMAAKIADAIQGVLDGFVQQQRNFANQLIEQIAFDVRRLSEVSNLRGTRGGGGI